MKILLLPICFSFLTGCASYSAQTPNYDARFGNAVRQARLQMTINPEASNNSDQAIGMDGKSAKETMSRYQDTFKTPPPTANVINIGGSIGGK